MKYIGILEKAILAGFLAAGLAFPLMGVEFEPNLIERVDVVDYPELPDYGTVPWKFIAPREGFEPMLRRNGRTLRLKAAGAVKIEKYVDNDALRQTLSFRYRNTPDSQIRLTMALNCGRVEEILLDETLRGDGGWEKTFTTPRILELTAKTRRSHHIEDALSVDTLRIAFELTDGAELELSGIRLAADSDRLTPDNTPFFTAEKIPVIGIRLPENPGYWHIVSAEKLRKYLFAMTGKLPPLSTGGEADDHINLGFAPPPELAGAPDNSYLVRSGKRISIHGKTPYDHISGVYDLLRRCGIRFLTRMHQEIPEIGRLEFPAYACQGNTPFLIRYHLADGDPLGMGYSSSRLVTPQFHHTRRVVPHHTNRFIVPDELYVEHPEYFALQKDGTRNDPRKHRVEKPLCYSNPDVQRLYREKAAEWLRKMPQSQICWLTAHDYEKWCVCRECRSLDKGDSYTRLFMELLNKVAVGVRSEFPGRKIGTFAYTRTSEPVDGLKLEPELWITYALYPPYFSSQSIFDSPGNARGMRQLKGWQKNIAPARLAAFDYPELYISQFSLTVPFEAMNEKIAYFRQNNFGGVTFCNITEQFGPLMEYVWGKMFWNDAADIGQLVKEHIEFYYGQEAAPYMLEYFQLINRHVRENRLAQSCENVSVGMVNAELLERAYPLLDRALAVAAPNTRPWRAIRRDKAVLLYSELRDFNINNAPLYNDYQRFARNAAELIRMLDGRTYFTERPMPFKNVNVWFSNITGVEIKKHNYRDDPVMKQFLAEPEKMIAPRELPVVPAGRAITPEQMFGGVFYQRYSHQCAPRQAMNIHRQSSPWSTLRAAFAGGDYSAIVLHGIGDSRPVRMELNGQTIFSGAVKFTDIQQGWGKFTVPLPAGAASAERNELKIHNLYPDPPGNARSYGLGWLMLSSIEPVPRKD